MVIVKNWLGVLGEDFLWVCFVGRWGCCCGGFVFELGVFVLGGKFGIYGGWKEWGKGRGGGFGKLLRF